MRNQLQDLIYNHIEERESAEENNIVRTGSKKIMICLFLFDPKK